MQQKVTVLNKHGKKLLGVLHDTGSPQLVVLCHGFRSTKEYRIMVNIAAALEKEGISAIRFDFSGNGESEGSFQFGNYFDEVDDLRSVVEYFVESNRSTVAVLGHSKGGDVVLLYASKYHDIPAVVNLSGRYDLKRGIQERFGKDIWERLKKDGCIDVKTKTGGDVVLLYASKYHDIPAVVNLSGRYDLKRGIQERFGKDIWERLKKDGCIDVKTKTGEVEYRVTEESMKERLDINMREACLLVDANCRLLTVHGSADDVIPVEDAKEFAKILPNHQLKIIEGANHGYSSHQDELVSAVLPFLKECVQHHQHAST